MKNKLLFMQARAVYESPDARSSDVPRAEAPVRMIKDLNGTQRPASPEEITQMDKVDKQKAADKKQKDADIKAIQDAITQGATATKVKETDSPNLKLRRELLKNKVDELSKLSTENPDASIVARSVLADITRIASTENRIAKETKDQELAARYSPEGQHKIYEEMQAKKSPNATASTPPATPTDTGVKSSDLAMLDNAAKNKTYVPKTTGDQLNLKIDQPAVAAQSPAASPPPSLDKTEQPVAANTKVKVKEVAPPGLGVPLPSRLD